MINIEGRNPVIEALKTGHKIQHIFLKKGASGEKIDLIIKQAQQKGIPLEMVTSDKLEHQAQTHSYQGVIALAEEFDLVTPAQILQLAKDQDEPPFIVILDQVQDPHNFGAIIRTAHAAGAHGLIFPKDRAATITSSVIKASAGAVEHIKLAQVTNINYLIRDLKDAGLWIAGADINSKKLYYETDLTGPLGVVIGNEGTGLRRLVKENCDFLIKIPMKGELGSLNASVATGIIIYEVIRQRKG